MQMRCGPPGKSGNIHFQIKYLKKVLSIKPDNCTLFSYFKALKEMKPCVQLFLYPKYFYIIGGDVTLILSTKSNKNFSVTERDAFLLCFIYLPIYKSENSAFVLSKLPTYISRQVTIYFLTMIQYQERNFYNCFSSKSTQ